MRLARALLFTLLLLLPLATSSARAQPAERILDYRVAITVQADGSLDVVERIRVRAMGSDIRRGIYRDFPTRYEDRFGNRVVVDLIVVDVQRDERPEPWFTERLDNGVRINTGSDAFLAVPGDYEYTLRYHTTRQLGFFADHDELYWNAIGNGWAFWIDQASVDVQLPAAVPIEQMHAEGYTGFKGTRGQDYRALLTAPGRAHFELNRPLAATEGFTIVLTFPKGIVAAPTDAQRLRWFLHDNRGVLVALIGWLVLLVFCFLEWRRVGRDPAKGVIIPRYEPPRDHTPASLRYVRRMGYDMRCFSAEVLSLAVAGWLRIEREDRFLGDEWRLEEAEGAGARDELSPAQRALQYGIFADGARSLVLKNSNARLVSNARAAHEKVLDEQNNRRYFELNRTSSVSALGLAVAASALAFWLSNGWGIPAIVVIVVLMVVTLIVFARLVRAPTRRGRKLLDEIEGLALYLSVAERDELASMKGPGGPAPLDAARYERLLPFAVALEVEDAWTEKFTAAVGAAAAAATAAGISWYRGGNLHNLGELSSAVGSSLSSQISSAATPPGSSSGSGGGGSSGGGGGGGGGGGR